MKNSIRLRLVYSTDIPHGGESFLENIAELRFYLEELPGVEVVDDTEAADLYIVLLDHHPDGFINEVSLLSERRVKIWCFIPRSMPLENATTLLFDKLNAKRGFQAIFPYDSTDDVLRMVANLVGHKSPVPV